MVFVFPVRAQTVLRTGTATVASVVPKAGQVITGTERSAFRSARPRFPTPSV